MKQNHCPLSQNLRMAAAALTATSIMASKVFRPVIRAGVAAAVILAALIAAVVTGKKIADRRRSPWEKFTGNLRRNASGSENQVEHPLLTFLFRQFNKPFHPLNRYKNPLYRFFISIYHKKYHFLLSNTTTQNCLFSKSFLSAVSFLNSLHQNFISNCIQSIEGV